MKRSGVCAAAIALLMTSSTCYGQIDPKNVPKPPATELSKFDPFLGKYEVAGSFAKLPWAGTLEWKKVIKGWYVEQIILIKSAEIDREFWILTTWDNAAHKYPAWGYQTMPERLPSDAEVRFEGKDMITQWSSRRPDGSVSKLSNLYRFDTNGELGIWSYRQVENGPKEQIGFLKGKHIAGQTP